MIEEKKGGGNKREMHPWSYSILCTKTKNKTKERKKK